MGNADGNIQNKRGYLRGDFEFFHLKDRKNTEFEFHYHDFSKIIIFVSGQVTYLIEGKAYKLKPWDIILVSSKEIHKPLIDSSVPYERIVIWVNPDFLDKHSSEDCVLSSCFEVASQNNYSLLRLDPADSKNFRQILSQLEAACKSDDFGARILKNSLFMQFIVFVNRSFLGLKKENIAKDIESDDRINQVLEYINRNLKSELSIEVISSFFFISKYYLMHKFKEQTGYSIHNYILQKRLIEAKYLLKKGLSASEICIECGFGDYSSFVRAFKKMFGMSPRNYYKSIIAFKHEKNGHF